MDQIAPDAAFAIVRALRAHHARLRDAGIVHLSLFGSVARGEAGLHSDIDLVAEFDPAAKIDLVRMVGLERELGELLGGPVQILPEPIEHPGLRRRVEQDRIRAF